VNNGFVAEDRFFERYFVRKVVTFSGMWEWLTIFVMQCWFGYMGFGWGRTQDRKDEIFLIGTGCCLLWKHHNDFRRD
jgi:hypothetical protein